MCRQPLPASKATDVPGLRKASHHQRRSPDDTKCRKASKYTASLWPGGNCFIARGESCSVATARSISATMVSMLGCGLTFDMSGRRQTAKLAVDCPLDGRVRRPSHYPPRCLRLEE